MNLSYVIFKNADLGNPLKNPSKLRAKMTHVINSENFSNDPFVLDAPLALVYSALAKSFPPMNGPEAADDNDVDSAIDYSFLPDAIVANMCVSQFDEFHTIVTPLLHDHDCHMYDYGYDEIERIEHAQKSHRQNTVKAILHELAMTLRDMAILFILCMLFYPILQLLLLLPADHTFLFIDWESITFGTWTIVSSVLASIRLLPFPVFLWRLFAHRRHL